MNIIVSACLLGMKCRYDGSGQMLMQMQELKEKHHLIPVCPEIYGGLSTPRDAAEKIGDRVFTQSGEEVTQEYRKGAKEIGLLADFFQCQYAILKERSPSCGYGTIYDGTFSGKLVQGNGILAEELSGRGMEIIGESQISQFLDLLGKKNKKIE